MKDYNDWKGVFGGDDPPDTVIPDSTGCTCKCWVEPFIKAVACTTDPRCPIHGWKKESESA